MREVGILRLLVLLPGQINSGSLGSATCSWRGRGRHPMVTLVNEEEGGPYDLHSSRSGPAAKSTSVALIPAVVSGFQLPSFPALPPWNRPAPPTCDRRAPERPLLESSMGSGMTQPLLREESMLIVDELMWAPNETPRSPAGRPNHPGWTAEPRHGRSARHQAAHCRIQQRPFRQALCPRPLVPNDVTHRGLPPDGRDRVLPGSQAPPRPQSPVAPCATSG